MWGAGINWKLILYTSPFIWLPCNPEVLPKPDVSLSSWPPEKSFPCDNLAASFDKPREYLLSHTFVIKLQNTNLISLVPVLQIFLFVTLSLCLTHTHTKRNTRYTEIICHLILPLVGSPSVSFCPFLPTLFLPFLSFLFPFSVMLSDVSKSLGKKPGSPLWERVVSGHHQTLSLLERFSSYINWLQ